MGDSSVPIIAVAQTSPAIVRRGATRYGPLGILAVHAVLFVLSLVAILSSMYPQTAPTSQALLFYAVTSLVGHQMVLVVQWMVVGTTRALLRSLAGVLSLAVLLGTYLYANYLVTAMWAFVEVVTFAGLQAFLVAGPLAIARLSGTRLVREPAEGCARVGGSRWFRWTMRESLLWVLLLCITTGVVRFVLQRNEAVLDFTSGLYAATWCAAALAFSLAMMTALRPGKKWRAIAMALALLTAAKVSVYLVEAYAFYEFVAELDEIALPWREYLTEKSPSFAIDAALSVILPLATYLAVRWCRYRWLRDEPTIQQESA